LWAHYRGGDVDNVFGPNSPEHNENVANHTLAASKRRLLVEVVPWSIARRWLTRGIFEGAG
jgi:hypothetical protein